MENLLVSGLFEAVLGALAASAPLDKFENAWKVNDGLKRMQSTLYAIQAVLQDAEQKQWKDASVKNWLVNLKEVAYDANDLIDEFNSEAAISEARSKRGVVRKAGNYVLGLKHPYFCLTIGRKIKELNERLAALNTERQQFLLNTNPVEQPTMSRIPTTAIEVLSKPIGQDGQKEKVKKALLENLKSKREVLAYAIYGMGGYGKTTLAKTIFHDHRLMREFKRRIWVCVSEDFDIPRLIRAMLESIDGNARKDLQEVEGLRRELKKKLSHKRFLLILDDVWNQATNKWDEFRNILSDCGAKGSAIIITTRSQDIALMMTNHPSCLCLSRLSKEDSWSLFQQQAIGKRRTEGYMKRIGKELVEKCCGVPLAINALGGVMRAKDGEDEWKSVNESGIWNFQDENMEALSSSFGVSFYHLSPQLRQCFLYCCIFPKDHVLDKDDLIRLWMANGFIPTRNWSVIGEEIFDKLVSRSFIQDVEETDENFKKVTTCKIHHLMHDLGLHIMGDDCLSAGIMARTTPASSKVPKVRHLYCETSPPSIELSSTNFQSVKSFFGKGSSRWDPNVDPTFVIKMKYLRVLSVGFEEKELLEGISRLAHLRYLNLSGNGFEVLPESIIYLQNLQSLNLENCRSLSKLPDGLIHINSLRYLNIRGCSRLQNTPDTKYLASQQMTIDGLVVKLDNRGRCEISVLKKISVFGELNLRQLQNIKNPKDAGEANLKSKSKLRQLVLQWDKKESDEKDVVVSEGVIEALQPPPNLKGLNVYDYPGSGFPSWLDSLHLLKLTSIKLEGCRRCEKLPPLEKLLHLVNLSLSSMPSVKFLVRGTSDKNASLFPALRKLKLYEMPGLEAWNEETRNRSNGGGGLDMFKNLEDLEVIDCENLMVAASSCSLMMISLQTLRVTNYNQLVSFCQGVTELDLLHVESCLKDDTPSLQHLTSVRHLRIEGCENLTALPVSFLGTFNTFSTLTIARCPNLTTFPDGMLCGSCKELNISECPKLDKKKFKEGGEFWHLISHIYPEIHIEDESSVTKPRWLQFSRGYRRLSTSRQ